MKKRFLFFLLCVSCLLRLKSFAQNVAINEDGSAANTNAILDIKSSNKGILIPRVSTSARLAIPNTKGLLVFDSTAGSFFFNTGVAWQNLATGTSVSAPAGWLLTGNSSIDPSNQFIGTTDNQPLRFRVNNTWSGELHPVTGNISLGMRAASGCAGFSNIAIGTDALRMNASSSNLVAIGDSALFHNNGTGDSLGARFNTAVGSKSLFSNTTGYNNTAVGYRSVTSNSIGGFITAIGAWSLFSNTSGMGNTANGYKALFENTIGNSNTAIGNEALTRNTMGGGNTAIGQSALHGNTTSEYNTAVGYSAGSKFNIGWNNTLIGAFADVSSSDFYNCVSIGNNAICTAPNQARIGNSSTTSIGGYANWTNISDGRYKKNIKEDVKGIDFIMKLRPITYQLDIKGINKKLNEDQGRGNDEFSKKAIAEKEKTVFTGFVAQEVEKAAKEVGYNFSGVDIPKTENEFYGLRYSEFVVPLVKAVQEQQQLIADLQKQIAELKLQLQRSK